MVCIVAKIKTKDFAKGTEWFAYEYPLTKPPRKTQTLIYAWCYSRPRHHPLPIFPAPK